MGDVLHDVADLIQLELHLAKAELASNFDSVVWKVASLAIAAVFALVTVLALAEAAIFALIDYGMTAYVACLAVGGASALLALIAYVVGRGRAALTPGRRHTNCQEASDMAQFRGIDPINDDSWLMAKVKQNPEAFLVLAAGCALLLRGSGLGSMVQRSGARNEGWNDLRERTAATARGYAADLRDRVSDTTAAASDKASGYATALSENASAISERASDYVSSLSDQATDWGRNVADEATRMGARARSSMQTQADRMVREQPFAIAALGVAVAALLPPSQVQRDALRPVRDAASEAVTGAAERAKGAVSAIAEHLKDAAEQKGLTPERLKDVARNATQTFGDTLARGTEPRGPSSPQPAPSRPGSL